MIIPHYYEDPHTLHVGTMPNRAYYIPAFPFMGNFSLHYYIQPTCCSSGSTFRSVW